MAIKRSYLGWDHPFSLVFAGYLKKTVGYPDLSNCLIWVPSARAGRHMLNELFPGESKPEAFHPPGMVTPVRFFGELLSGKEGIAIEAQCLWAWSRVLREVDLKRISPLFPVVPSHDRTGWAYATARELMRLKSRLAEDGHCFASLREGPLSCDRERWRVLSELESAYHRKLSRQGVADPDQYLEEHLERLLEEILYQQVLVAGVMNLSARMIGCLELIERKGIPVELVLPIPQSHAEVLDGYGRPEPVKLKSAQIPDSLLDGRVIRTENPRMAVEQILAVAESYRNQVDALVVGTPDAELSDYLIASSSLGKSPFYAPEGLSLARTGYGRLLRLYQQWLSGGSLRVLLELIRHEFFRGWLVREGQTASALEEAVLRLMTGHLLENVAQASDPVLENIPYCRTIASLAELIHSRLSKRLPGESFADGLWRFIQTMRPEEDTAGELKENQTYFEEKLLEIKEELGNAGLEDADHWELIGHLLETGKVYPERGEEQRPVCGWLEMPWETAPHLVLLSLPDDQIPGRGPVDTFITPTLCREVGLRGPEDEAAFHQFRLRLLLESRKSWGRVDLLLPDRGLKEDPVLPSRFLFNSGKATLLKRVHLLMDERKRVERPIPSEFGGSIEIPKVRNLESISVTDFKAYLENPFHYYLERRLRWEAPQTLPREMDPLAFGQLAHRIMERLNRDPQAVVLVEGREIEDFLNTELDEVARGQFGSSFSLPVRIQLESLRERLKAASAVIASERSRGWKPVQAEWKWSDEIPLKLGGVSVHGKIDLIEFNEEENRYRIIDYKTSEKPINPKQSHLMSVKAKSEPPSFPECEFVHDGKRHRWKDLQLPMYLLATRQRFPEPLSYGYFQLPKAVGDVGLAEWAMDEAMLQATERCAEAIIKRIHEGLFPRPEKTRYADPWLAWFGPEYAGCGGLSAPAGSDDERRAL